MTSIKIAGIVKDSVVDGEGYRYAIFVQGCPHDCKGCHNPQTHDFSLGREISASEILAELKEQSLISGVTFSGGEPFCQPKPLYELAKEIHALGFDLWVYTGYTLEELYELESEGVKELLSQADVLIDGRYEEKERDLSLAFRGSQNQRIIDMNKTRECGQVVLKEI